MKILEKLLKVQQEIPKIEKDGKNPHFKNNYATLPNILSIILPILQRHGLVYTASQEFDNGSDVLNIRIVDSESGDHVSSRVRLLGSLDMQKLGSAHTYACRYGLLNLLGQCADIDDDGNSACEKPSATVESAKPVVEKPKEKVIKKIEKSEPIVANIELINSLISEKDHLLSEKYKEEILKRIQENKPEQLIRIQQYLEKLK